MKLLIVAIILCGSECQARGYYRRQLVAPAQTTTDNQFPNMITHQTNVLTGRLILRVSDFLEFVINKLQQLKQLFDDYNWTTLSSYTSHWIDILQQYNKNSNSVENDEKLRQFGDIFSPNPPCAPFDPRYVCQIAFK